MNHTEQVAYHEAAHAVLAIHYGMGLSGGIDLNAETSVDGAFGNVAVNLWQFDSSTSLQEQKSVLVCNLAVICAGAASDAKLKGIPLTSALDAQPGDYKKAVEIARTCGLAADEYEVDFMVKEVGLVRASRDAEKREVWEAIVRVATATLEAGGKLSKEKVAALGAVSHSLGG